jgi:hypothetical protein
VLENIEHAMGMLCHRRSRLSAIGVCGGHPVREQDAAPVVSVAPYEEPAVRVLHYLNRPIRKWELKRLQPPSPVRDREQNAT